MIQLALATSSGDDSSTGRVCERDQPDPDAASGGADQHDLPRLDIRFLQPADRHVAVVERCESQRQIQAVRDVEELLGRHDHPFGVATSVVRAGPARPGHDAAADPVGIHAFADGDHRARHAGPGYERSLDLEVLAAPAAPQLRVEKQDLGQGDLDDGLPRPGGGLRCVPRHQHLGPAEPRDLYHPHEFTPAARCALPRGRS